MGEYDGAVPVRRSEPFDITLHVNSHVCRTRSFHMSTPWNEYHLDAIEYICYFFSKQNEISLTEKSERRNQEQLQPWAKT